MAESAKLRLYFYSRHKAPNNTIPILQEKNITSQDSHLYQINIKREIKHFCVTLKNKLINLILPKGLKIMKNKILFFLAVIVSAPLMGMGIEEMTRRAPCIVFIDQIDLFDRNPVREIKSIRSAETEAFLNNVHLGIELTIKQLQLKRNLSAQQKKKVTGTPFIDPNMD